MPPSSSHGLGTLNEGPSRHLFFAQPADEFYSEEDYSPDKASESSTIRDKASYAAAHHVMKGNNGAIETFRDFQEGGTQADFLRAAINSAHSND